MVSVVNSAHRGGKKFIEMQLIRMTVHDKWSWHLNQLIAKFKNLVEAPRIDINCSLLWFDSK